MRATRLLEDAIAKHPETVLDIAVGQGKHTQAFISTGSKVTGIDVMSEPFEHDSYTHIKSPYESADLKEKFDLVWCCHTLEHMPNIQHFLLCLSDWIKDDGWLYIAVPTALQNRIHIGHLTLWTPALLAYNLICAGWDCKDAKWYTEYLTIGMCIQRKPEIDLSWRTGMPSEVFGLNEFTPRPMLPESGTWWGNNWQEETGERIPDPPGVTLGMQHTDLPPETQLAFGPNPKLRIGYERVT